MMYAAIPCRYKNKIPWIFDVQLDGWHIERMLENGAVQCYVGIKGEIFSEEQITVLFSLEGVVFEDSGSFSRWLTLYGQVPFYDLFES